MAAQNEMGTVDGRVSISLVDGSTTPSVITNQCIKQEPIRKVKPIPPPLDLSKRGPLDVASSETHTEYGGFSISPRSPASANQKHLPFRKRYVTLIPYCFEHHSYYA